MLRFGRARGLRRESWAFWKEVFLLVRHLYGVLRARALPLDRPLRLNLGSFDDVRPGWVNVDPFVVWGGTLPLDLREPLPFPDASAELVHAEHFLEHLLPSDAVRLLRECRRVLREGGLLSVAVPDAEPLLRAYPAAVDDEPLRRDELPTPLGRINYLFRGGGTHLYAYDEETLRYLLGAAGFGQVERRAYDPGLDYRSDDETLRVRAS